MAGSTDSFRRLFYELYFDRFKIIRLLLANRFIVGHYSWVETKLPNSHVPMNPFLLLVVIAHSLAHTYADSTGKSALNWQPNFTLPVDRPYTLRLEEKAVLESELSRQMQNGGPMSFIFPRPCFSEVDGSRVCGEIPGFAYQDIISQRALGVKPAGAYEYRYWNENIHSFEAGLYAAGGSGPVSFDLDARMFSELHEQVDHVSYDREFIEKQDETASGSIAYTSFSRYRAHLALDLNWGRFVAGRDAPHWGPGVIENLTFNRQAIPFNQLSFTTHLGPLTAQTLYGQLLVEGDKIDETDPHSRSIYAHRYELRLGKAIVLGASEQLIVYDYEEPAAFLPIVPLFIFKGATYEKLNNGNLSVDANWRIKPWIRIYGEFLVDDLQSPSSLFDDFWGNKWATMGGFHLAGSIHGREIGAIAEVSRIEPWVYTHYRAATAQSANDGYPLGNASGPNSLGMAGSFYCKASPWHFGIQGSWLLKGRDLGSGLQDIHREGYPSKSFLGEPISNTASLMPWLEYNRPRFAIHFSAALQDASEIRLRILSR